jgi:SAM-dependent methyltransferase
MSNVVNTPSTLPAAAPIIAAVSPTATVIHWIEKGEECSALWRSERGMAPPKRVVLADDTLPADTAYRLACEGTGLLWRGDFHNARQLLQAMARRLDKPKAPARQKKPKAAVPDANGVMPEAVAAPVPAPAPGQAFHLYRQAKAHRARVLAMVLLPIGPDYAIRLRRAPDAKQACTQAWGKASAITPASVTSLREVLGLIGAHEWRKAGVEIERLGVAPLNRIFPHYGVFSPVRGEYVSLVAGAPLPAQPKGSKTPYTAFDIGTGTGVLAALLVRRGVAHVVATDTDPRALACAKANLAQLGVAEQVELQAVDLFPAGLASLIVCNPPWLPARPGSPIEHAIYDEGSAMLLGYLKGLAVHLAPGGEGWLVLSDLAEHLGLRTRAFLLQAFVDAGLEVLGRTDAKPVHPKAQDITDGLYEARSKEVTSLWRLGAKAASTTVELAALDKAAVA